MTEIHTQENAKCVTLYTLATSCRRATSAHAPVWSFFPFSQTILDSRANFQYAGFQRKGESW